MLENTEEVLGCAGGSGLGTTRLVKGTTYAEAELLHLRRPEVLKVFSDEGLRFFDSFDDKLGWGGISDGCGSTRCRDYQ